MGEKPVPPLADGAPKALGDMPLDLLLKDIKGPLHKYAQKIIGEFVGTYRFTNEEMAQLRKDLYEERTYNILHEPTDLMLKQLINIYNGRKGGNNKKQLDLARLADDVLDLMTRDKKTHSKSSHIGEWMKYLCGHLKTEKLDLGKDFKSLDAIRDAVRGRLRADGKKFVFSVQEWYLLPVSERRSNIENMYTVWRVPLDAYLYSQKEWDNLTLGEREEDLQRSKESHDPSDRYCTRHVYTRLLAENLQYSQTEWNNLPLDQRKKAVKTKELLPENPHLQYSQTEWDDLSLDQRREAIKTQKHLPEDPHLRYSIETWNDVLTKKQRMRYEQDPEKCKHSPYYMTFREDDKYPGYVQGKRPSKR